MNPNELESNMISELPTSRKPLLHKSYPPLTIGFADSDHSLQAWGWVGQLAIQLPQIHQVLSVNMRHMHLALNFKSL